MSYATELHTDIEFENNGYRLIARGPDEDYEISITIEDVNETTHTLTLDEAEELGEFLIEHVKNARNQ